MLENIPVEKIFKTALSHGGDMAEIFAEETTTTAISHEEKKIERAVCGMDTGYGLRVVCGERTACGFTNDPAELVTIADAIGKIASSINRAKQPLDGARGMASPPRQLPLKVEKRENDPQDDIKEETAVVRMAAERAWSFGEFIRQVQVNYKKTERRISVVNSDGLCTEDKKDDEIMVVWVVAAKDGRMQTGYEPVFGRIKPEETASTAAGRALLMLSSRDAPRGPMPVVISSSAGGTMIHEAVGHGLEADLALHGMSVYSGKIGKKVASPLITVIDDATMAHQRGSFAFDDEGAPAQRTVLIENGMLKSYMHDELTAKLMKVRSTGNGRRESYRSRPIVRMTNTIIAPGNDEPDSILASVAKGLFVKKMGGGQVNTINGDFVFEAQEAYLIENGRIGESVRGATLIGNGPKVLMSIDMVGSDLGFGIGTCGKEGQGVPVGHGMPTVRIPEITVGGTG